MAPVGALTAEQRLSDIDIVITATGPVGQMTGETIAPDQMEDATDTVNGHVADVSDATSPTLRVQVTRGDVDHYCLPDGNLARSMREIVGDDIYCFDASYGHLITGGHQHDGRWCYFDPVRG